jgi:hypothetical protein
LLALALGLSQNRLSEAEPLFREAVASRTATLGHENAVTAGSAVNLALLLRDTGDVDEATQLVRNAAGIFTRLLGPTHPSTMWSCESLASILVASGAEPEQVASELAAVSCAGPGVARKVALDNESMDAEVTDVSDTSTLSAAGEHLSAEDILRFEMQQTRPQLGVWEALASPTRSRQRRLSLQDSSSDFTRPSGSTLA